MAHTDTAEALLIVDRLTIRTAAGKPLVAVDLPELRPLAAQGLVSLAGDARGFAAAIETALADFDTLGIKMRGYHDFGVNLQDARGGVKSKGEA